MEEIWCVEAPCCNPDVLAVTVKHMALYCAGVMHFCFEPEPNTTDEEQFHTLLIAPSEVLERAQLCLRLNC